MVVIYVLSHQPGKISSNVSDMVAETLQIEQESKYIAASAQPLFAGLSLRKYAHIILYFMLGLGAFLVIKDKKWKWNKQLLVAMGICFFYSCSDEFHQIFVPGRGASIRDLYVDAIGYGIAIMVLSIMTILLRKNN